MPRRNVQFQPEQTRDMFTSRWDSKMTLRRHRLLIVIVLGTVSMFVSCTSSTSPTDDDENGSRSATADCHEPENPMTPG
jgi:hypothetical protein